MTVSIILKNKGSDIVAMKPDATVAEAVACLTENRIGAVVIVDDAQAVVGIISERDIVRLLSRHETKALEAKLDTVMTHAVVTCTPDENITTIMERMTRGRFRHVPVVSGTRLVGIISIGDVVKYRLEEMERQHAELRDYIMTA
ncbi:CBS domain-containing protein [Xanthobacter sp. TB0139]|uniref:CBS domain-containing protein n=1 Tax=Xanthobacter sp. TB0139 TaxID=3459178 RepID=UPI00403A21D4